MATLKGMTWDHPRGFDPLIAVGPAALKDPGVTVEWDRRSLRDFEHFPLEDLARTYDLIIMDHPHIGDAIASEAVIPMEELLSPERLAALRDDCLPVIWNSYVVNDRTWALPVDAATQVLVWRPGTAGQGSGLLGCGAGSRPSGSRSAAAALAAYADVSLHADG